MFQLADGLHDLVHVVVAEQLGVTQLVRPHTRGRADETVAELVDTHLQTEDGRAGGVLHGRVVGDVEGKGRFAHAGSGGQDDEVGGPQPLGLVVQVLEAGKHAAAHAVVFGAGYALEGLADDLFE